MAELIVVLWRDIPAQVIARRSRREQVKRVLAPRFAEAIDKAAMRGGARDADSYLQEWRKSAPESIPSPCDENLEQAADKRASELEEAYDDERLAALVANGGAEQESPKEPQQESPQESRKE